MKKFSLFIASFALCTLVTINASAQKKPSTSGCGTDVRNLSLTVEAGAYNIQADKAEAYATKKVKGDQIEAMFQIGNCSQDFTLNLISSPRFMYVNFPNGGGSYQAKFYNFDRVASVPITPTTLDASNAFVNGSQFCTATPQLMSGFVVGKNADGTYKDNYGGCAVDAEGKAYVKRNVGISLDDVTNDDYRLRFQYSPLDGTGNGENVTGTSFIKVYHPDANTWILMPETQINPTTGLAESIGVKMQYVNGLIPRGTYDMPFRFVLKKV